MALVLYRQAIAADQSLPTRTFLLPQSVELTLRQQKAVEPSAQLGTSVLRCRRRGRSPLPRVECLLPKP
jgi:hypothetical protein